MMQTANNQQLFFIRKSNLTPVFEGSIKPLLKILNRIKNCWEEKIKEGP